MTQHNVPQEAKPAPGSVHYDGPVGGWGSVEGMAAVEKAARAGPGFLDTLAHQNKPGGTMCVSCAYSKPPKPAAAEFCENGAKATIWDLTTARCTPEVVNEHSVFELSNWSEYDLEMLGRLTEPMRYDAASDRYVTIDWETAFAEIGAKLRALEPKRTIFYTSGKASLETAYLFGLFARIYGHNNLPDSSNMCHETTSVGLKKVIGSPVGTCTMEDLGHCDAVFYLGQNPGTNSPRLLHPLKDMVERGVNIVVFNPLKEKGLIEFADPQSPLQMTVAPPTPLASQYLQVTPGGDIAALIGVAKHVLALDEQNRARGGPGLLDRAFIAEQTKGFEEFIAFVEKTEWSSIEAESGLKREALERAGDVYTHAKAVIGIYGMGLTQHVHGSHTLGVLVNLLLLRGNIGRSGAGVTPIRGHSNVQGQRTVGITEKPELAPMDKYRELFDFEPPTEKGDNTVEFLEKLIKGEVQAFVGLGGNLARAAPDHTRVFKAWREMELTVHVATRLNRTHLTPGRASYLLPCLSRVEKDMQKSGSQQVSMEDSFSHIYGSTGRRTPAGPLLKSELAIVCGLAKATLPPHPKQTWDEWTSDYALVRELITKSFPEEFHDMEKRMNQPGGFYRGNGAHNRKWKTESGRAEFTVPASLDATGLERKAGRFRLITVRSNDQFNTTVYGYSDRLRGIEGDRMVVMMRPDDIRAAGLSTGQRIALESDIDDGFVRRVDGLKVTPYDLPPGSLCGYFPELNPLAPLSRHDEASGTPAAKSIPVRIVV